MLNMSRPTFIKLLDSGDIPFSRTGNRRKVAYADLMEYKNCLEENRLATLAELSAIRPRNGYGVLMASYTVILDACVMYPAPLRSYLMYLANTGLFRARWTEQIHDEWTRNLLKNRPELNAEQLQRTRQLMNANVPDCMIEGYKSLIDGLSLPDVDDRGCVTKLC